LDGLATFGRYKATLAISGASPALINGPMVRSHQPGQAVFKSVLPEDIDWKPFPAFPPSVRLAVVVGQPSEPGPYTIRVKVPAGVKLMPHRHPEDRVYTVISGVFYIGLGDQFDGDKVYTRIRLVAFPHYVTLHRAYVRCHGNRVRYL
jgi:hypothetical protein